MLRCAVHAPIDRETHAVLRAAVLALVDARPGRRFAPVLHAGRPGLAVRHHDPRPVSGGAARADDAGLRADLALALLRRARALHREPLVWLTRPGELSAHDDDLRWLGPTSWAAQALGLPVGLVVVTPRGWFDPVSGVQREWQRMRPRTPG